MPARARRRQTFRVVSRAPEQRLLFRATDNSSPVLIDPRPFTGAREKGWGPFAESFLRFNEPALRAIDARPELATSSDGTVLRLVPGGRAGAIPLRSAQTGHVAAGFVVRPRFGWAGIGRVLTQTGWAAAPEFLQLPLVPGSGREVPPWVLAGPVLARLSALIRRLRRGYEEREELLNHPRGRILWREYLSRSFVRGQWSKLPCRFPDLDTDPLLRREIRWAVERVRDQLRSVGGTDLIARLLLQIAQRLLEHLGDVPPATPRRDRLRRLVGDRFVDHALREGLEAIGWVVDERGLGGGREQDGLAWQLPLDRLWESYVEAVTRRDAALTGAQVRVGRLRETIFPLRWTEAAYASLGHLAPDIVVRRGRLVQIIDAKYKAHLADLDDDGWRRFTDDAQESHRADVHQVLAYAALYQADEITATLVYPLRRRTWEVLSERRRDISRADLLHGGRRVTLELRGLPFGESPNAGTVSP